jgi:hypothetical protein
MQGKGKGKGRRYLEGTLNLSSVCKRKDTWNNSVFKKSADPLEGDPYFSLFLSTEGLLRAPTQGNTEFHTLLIACYLSSFIEQSLSTSWEELTLTVSAHPGTI